MYKQTVMIVSDTQYIANIVGTVDGKSQRLIAKVGDIALTDCSGSKT